MVFQPELFSTNKARGYPFSDFWLAALTWSIPGYTTASQRDLAIANCGYVAYAKVLEDISTSARDACIIAVVPGTLRRYDELGRVQKRASRLTEVIANDMLRSREFIINDMTVRCFNQGGRYLGIQPREDPTGASLRHLVDRNLDAPVFRITTELRLSYSPPLQGPASQSFKLVTLRRRMMRKKRVPAMRLYPWGIQSRRLRPRSIFLQQRCHYRLLLSENWRMISKGEASMISWAGTRWAGLPVPKGTALQ
jgi:hypothetical protein